MGMRFRFVTVFGLMIVATSGNADPTPAVRASQFDAAIPAAAKQWQQISRDILVGLFKIRDLVNSDNNGTGRPALPLEAEIMNTVPGEKYARYVVTLKSTSTRKITITLTIPNGGGEYPAIVCLHGHNADRNSVYDSDPQYHHFAQVLAENGYVTISPDVGQHEVYEAGRILMGERLWDVMRTVDYLTTRPEVDSSRIAAMGFSLGGEMSMWISAMDSRIKATVTSGYLTTMDHMIHWFHCPCWKFDGLVENFDWADIYSLIAPRPLMAQIGTQDPFVAGFPLSIARPAMDEVKKSYRAFNQESQAQLFEHEGGHEVEVPSALAFMDQVLKKPSACTH